MQPHSPNRARYACPARASVLRDLAAHLETGAIVAIETAAGTITIGPYQAATDPPAYAVIDTGNAAHLCPTAERAAVLALDNVSATCIALYLRRHAVIAALAAL